MFFPLPDILGHEVSTWHEDIDAIHPSQHFLMLEELIDCGLFDVSLPDMFYLNSEQQLTRIS